MDEYNDIKKFINNDDYHSMENIYLYDYYIYPPEVLFLIPKLFKELYSNNIIEFENIIIEYGYNVDIVFHKHFNYIKTNWDKYINYIDNVKTKYSNNNTLEKIYELVFNNVYEKILSGLDSYSYFNLLEEYIYKYEKDILLSFTKNMIDELLILCNNRNVIFMNRYTPKTFYKKLNLLKQKN